MTIAMIPAVLEERAVAAAATLAGTCAHAISAKMAFGDHATACVRQGRMQAVASCHCHRLSLLKSAPPALTAWLRRIPRQVTMLTVGTFQPGVLDPACTHRNSFKHDAVRKAGSETPAVADTG